MLTNMTRDQIRHLDEFESVWPRYAALLRGRQELAGGMQWKPTVSGEYLTRYRSDPVTGRKVAKSLGRRAAETENVFEDFVRRREEARAESAELEPAVGTAGVFARALRLARLPAKHAEGLRNLYESGHLDEGGLVVSGLPAVLLYEAKARVLAPSEAVRDDGVAFLLPGPDPLTWNACMEFGIAFGGRRARIETVDSGGFGHRVLVGGVVLTLFTKGDLVDAAYSMRASCVEEMLDSALRAPPAEGFIFAKDATVAPVRAPDPRAFCLMAPLIAGDDDDRLHAAWRRVQTVEEIGRGRWPTGVLTNQMADALQELRELTDPDEGGAYPSP